MAWGFPDSWGIWAAKKIGRNVAQGVSRAGRGFSGPKQGMTYKFSHLIIYKPVLSEFLNGPSGQVWMVLERRAKSTVAQAKRQAGYKTGKLRKSITSGHTRTPYGQMIKIGSNVEYAYMHHEGTRPHVILPKGDHEFLRFSVGTRIVYTRIVNHPGTRPNRFLYEPLIKNFSDIAKIQKRGGLV